VKLTAAQRRLLALLPDRPDDGRYCKGPAYRMARLLEADGLAVCTGAGLWVGGYFARTERGKTTLDLQAGAS